MRKYMFLLVLMLGSMQAGAQDNLDKTEVIHKAEQLMEVSGAAENALQSIEDTQYELADWSSRKVDLNRADDQRLSAFPFLTPLQVRSILQYRRQMGDFLSAFELQNVPGLDSESVRLLLPLVSVDENRLLPFRELLKIGEHQFWARYSRVLETAKGYRPGSSGKAPYYTGSADHVLARYRYTVPGQFSVSLVAEKDAGESFFKSTNRYGFDFYGGHVWLQNRKTLKGLAVGDFGLQLGQGLICWQAWAPPKGAGSVMINRCAPAIRGYTGVNELNFMRGAGVTLGHKQWEWTGAVSYRRLDASDDPVTGMGPVSVSGYHRSVNELSRKHQVGLQTYAMSVAWRKNGNKIGLNALANFFDTPPEIPAYPYQYFSRPAWQSLHYSLDYALFAGNTYWFGEVAMMQPTALAFTHNLMVPLHARLDIALQYRRFPKNYVAFWANPFAERAGGNNEEGFYAGIRIKPMHKLTWESYWDVFRSGWLQYGVDGPGRGNEWFTQLAYRINKTNAVSFRLQMQQKEHNAVAEAPFYALQTYQRFRARVHYDYELAPGITGAGRVDYCRYSEAEQQHGFLFYHQVTTALQRGMQVQLRATWFDMDSYDARIYAYESDVLYGAAVPFFYNRGFRYYFNGSVRLTRNLHCWLKWGQTWYFNQPVVGSGYDEINRNHRSDFRLQVQYRI